MFKMFMIWGSKQKRKREKLGAKFESKLMRPEFIQIKGKVQGVKKILKSNFDVENVYGLGVKTAKKQGKLGEKFA